VVRGGLLYSPYFSYIPFLLGGAYSARNDGVYPIV
jgi:hypothetical protein